MATRIYLPDSGAPAISPAFGTGWKQNTGGDAPDRVAASLTKTGTALANRTIVGTTDVAVQHMLMRQHVLGPLAAQSITSQTLTGVIRCLESTAGYNATLAICVRRVDGSGNHVSDLISVTASDDTSTTPPEISGTANTRRFQDVSEATSLTLADTTFDEGDYLVIETGHRKNNTIAGRSATLRYGDNAATDFAHTDALTTDLNPWVEFSGALTLSTATGQPMARRSGGVPGMPGSAGLGRSW